MRWCGYGQRIDVTSLFTNIPVNESIEIISDQIFANCVYFKALIAQSSSNFYILFYFILFYLTSPQGQGHLTHPVYFPCYTSYSVKNCHFTFNDRIYQQIDGAAMGSPRGPLFANIFMSIHEKSWLHNCPSVFKPLLYRRHVDDCFLLFKSLNHAPLLTILITNILTSLLHLLKTVNFLFSMFKYLAQMFTHQSIRILGNLSFNRKKHHPVQSCLAFYLT